MTGIYYSYIFWGSIVHCSMQGWSFLLFGQNRWFSIALCPAKQILLLNQTPSWSGLVCSHPGLNVWWWRYRGTRLLGADGLSQVKSYHRKKLPERYVSVLWSECTIGASARGVQKIKLTSFFFFFFCSGNWEVSLLALLMCTKLPKELIVRRQLF